METSIPWSKLPWLIPLKAPGWRQMVKFASWLDRVGKNANTAAGIWTDSILPYRLLSKLEAGQHWCQSSNQLGQSVVGRFLDSTAFVGPLTRVRWSLDRTLSVLRHSRTPVFATRSARRRTRSPLRAGSSGTLKMNSRTIFGRSVFASYCPMSNCPRSLPNSIGTTWSRPAGWR